jgi:hypothetical protein
MPLNDDETPGQSMKRIEAEVRGIASAQRNTEGYSANVGAQRGPLSAMVMSSGDSASGAPQSYGVRGTLGPVSFTHTQPAAPVAPSRKVGVNVPFDADAYFGVNAAQTPGGRQYGVDVGMPLPAPRAPGGRPYEDAQGSVNAFGQYNPTRRDVAAGLQFERRFNNGGPVRMEEGGPYEAPPLTIRRSAPKPAPEGTVEARGPQPAAPISQEAVDYFKAQEVLKEAQRLASPMQLAKTIRPPEDLPEVQEAQRVKPRDELMVKMSAYQLQQLDQYGLELPENAAGFGVDDQGSYPVDAEGNRLKWERMSPAKWAFMQAGNIMGGVASPVKGAGMVVGAGPIRRGGKSIEEVVASMSKMDPEEVAAIRQENAGRGLEFPEESGLDRLRMNLQREQKAADKGVDMPGMPANERLVIRGPEGKPDFVTGKITPEDWVNRAEAMMSPAEIKEAAEWYKTIRNEFLKYTNGDQEKADKYMRAWLVTQQNVDVGGAMNNVLLQREQFGRGIPVEEMKAAGMPNPTGAARSVLQDEPIAQGVGQKIADFVDAAEGKDVRSWMANHPEGGAPFVVDVHTARDTGLVDEKLLNHLRRRGYNEEDIQKAVVDMKGTPSGPQYENRAHWGRNALTKHLNDIKWQGRSDWTPTEVQAVGWMGMTRLTADKAEDVVSGIERNVRRVSFEIAPGEGSPWEKMFGAEFSALPLQEQQRITQVVAEPAMEAASKISGIDLTNLVHGTGGWNMYQNPAAVGQALATKQGSEIAANVLGYLLQQTEVWSNSVKPMTKNPKAFAVDFMQESKGGNNYLASNEGIKDFWEQVQKMDPTAGSKKPLFVGYQPIVSADGRPGIRVLIDRGGVKTQSALEEAIKGPMSKMLEDFPTDISIRGHEAELTKARNDWKGQNNGQSYLARLEQLLGRNPAAELDPIRSQLEEIFKRELDSFKGPKRKAEGGEVKFAKGGSVESIDKLVTETAVRAHDVPQKQLAYLIRAASGMNVPVERAEEFAKQIIRRDTEGLAVRFKKYSNAKRTLMRLNAMLGGRGNNGFAQGGLFQADGGLRAAKEHAHSVLASNVGHPTVQKSLKNLIGFVK